MLSLKWHFGVSCKSSSCFLSVITLSAAIFHDDVAIRDGSCQMCGLPVLHDCSVTEHLNHGFINTEIVLI